ncbi:phenylalanyl-tRNA synthetase [Piedraia hortae CBS 480.64]|uniref:Phenylalanine--tRNA ligase, mitochondrial n=1 Tax=Piedraia hortae CBS 480.64 TaxID=1314780 RepID=A0A6A7C4V3_9PEZI|nr:phenylalanyl-tRNA synthetase [Piedraia hortae CBS 480.64]
MSSSRGGSGIHYPFWFGGSASSFAACVTHPLDLLKVRLQTQPQATRQTLPQLVAHILRNEGIQGLYRGLSASLLRQITYSTTRFGVYESLKGKLYSGGEAPGFAALVGLASVSGVLGGIAGNPADIINVRMQNDASLPQAQRRNYKNAVHGLVCMLRTEGTGSLFRGMGPNSARAALMTASQLATYDVFKKGLREGFGWKDGLATHFTASSLAGLVATTVCSPFDVVKTRVMSGHQREGIMKVVKEIVHKEGYGWVFRGWLPSFVRLGPHTVATFLFLEQHKRVYRFLVGVRPHTLARSYSTSPSPTRTILVNGKSYPTDSWTNTPPSILSYINTNLHTQPNHPLSITRSLLEQHLGPSFTHYNSLPPVVSVAQNFDSLGFSPTHAGRSRSDTYYLNQHTLLRTHTSAHEVDLFAHNKTDGYTVAADVYRRDAVDRSHFPVFHQFEGARTWSLNNFPGGREARIEAIIKDSNKITRHAGVENSTPTPEDEVQKDFHLPAEAAAIETHLKRSLENMILSTFAATGLKPRVRWVRTTFPHTSPSFEMEVMWKGDWLEVLGCGVVDQNLLLRAGRRDRIGWAFGIGLERIAMLLFEVPDIRLFWSRDQRFLEQFKEGEVRTFRPFSKYPPAKRDLAFWLPAKEGKVGRDEGDINPAGGKESETTAIDGPDGAVFHENDLMEIARQVAGNDVEDVKCVDDFTHPKTKRRSLCYRFTYRSLERTLTSEEANDMHSRIGEVLRERFGVELR